MKGNEMDDNRGMDMFGKLIIAAIVILVVTMVYVFWPSSAKADTLKAEAGASSEALAINESVAMAGAGSSSEGASVIINGQAPGAQNTTYSEARLENAPSLGGLALGGGHPCSYSPATGQISIIGGGAGFGGMKVDSACMLMVMGAGGDAQAHDAALYMLAARDPAACTAMEAMGMVTCAKKGTVLGIPGAPAVSTKGAVAPTGVKVGKCAFDASTNTIAFKAITGTGVDKATQLAACKSSLGF
jgi:hypothetical protein